MESARPSGLIEVRAAYGGSFDEIPNANDPAEHPPATVGPPTAIPGDPTGVILESLGTPTPWPGSRLVPSAWSGWPAEWETPLWQGHLRQLTDTAWACLDKNTSLLSTMPPYLVGAAPSLDAGWLVNPDPDLYTSWEEFAKQLFWDYQGCGEAFVLATAWYATGWPARFHCVPPWMVDSEIGADGLRHHRVGSVDITDEVLQIRYTSSVGDARGHGPLEVAGPRLVAAAALARYARTVATSGGIPHSVLKHPQRLTAEQSAALQSQWVEARMSTMGRVHLDRLEVQPTGQDGRHHRRAQPRRVRPPGSARAGADRRDPDPRRRHDTRRGAGAGAPRPAARRHANPAGRGAPVSIEDFRPIWPTAFIARSYSWREDKDPKFSWRWTTCEGGWVTSSDPPPPGRLCKVPANACLIHATTEEHLPWT